MRLHTKKLTEYACLLGFAMMVSYLEAVIPIPLGIPGAKLGLANVVIVFCLYYLGPFGAIMVNLCRILLCGLLFGNLYSILYSLAGAVFSILVMVFIKQIKLFSLVGVSVAGGVAHNIGQLLLALLITKVLILMYYVPFLLVMGALTGLLNGSVAGIVYKRVPKS